MPDLSLHIVERSIECFHSRGQHLCKCIGTKESVCIRKEFNSQRISLGHQHGRCFIVLGHQYGRRDVMWKHSICKLFWRRKHNRKSSSSYSSKGYNLSLRVRNLLNTTFAVVSFSLNPLLRSSLSISGHFKMDGHEKTVKQRLNLPVSKFDFLFFLSRCLDAV